MNKDLEHLKLLSIFHYIYAGLIALFSCVAIIYVVLGIVFIVAPEAMGGPHDDVPPEFVGWILLVMGGSFIVIGWSLAILAAMAGRLLSRHRRYWYCFVIATLSCLYIPLGTVLGVFTLIVLLRPSVKMLFGVASPTSPPSTVASP